MLLKKTKKYKKENAKSIQLTMRKYWANKYKNDVKFKVECLLRSRLYGAIKKQHGKKSCKTMELLGCTVDDLKVYLEKQFKEGMTWSNYGEWHIDHIKPCALFNLTNIEEQKKCFHYTNLQPLWAEDNLKKGDMYYG